MKPVRDSADKLDAAIDTLLQRELTDSGPISINPDSARVIRNLHMIAQTTPMRDTFMDELELQLLQAAEAPIAASTSNSAPQLPIGDSPPSGQITSARWKRRLTNFWRACTTSGSAVKINPTLPGTRTPTSSGTGSVRGLFKPALGIVGMALLVSLFIALSAMLQDRKQVINAGPPSTSTATVLTPMSTAATTAQADTDFVASLEPLTTIQVNLPDEDLFGKDTIAFSPDGSLLASITRDNNIALWNVTTGKHARTITTTSGHGEKLKGLAWSPDGRIFASSFMDAGSGVIILWDAADGRQLHTFQEPRGYITSMAWSPDGRTLAWSDGWAIRLWDATSGNMLPKPQPTWPVPLISRDYLDNVVRNLAWSPDGSRLATSQDDIIKIWNPADGQELAVLNLTGTVTNMSWSPGGRMMAASVADQYISKRSIEVWDVATGVQLNSLDTGVTFTIHMAWCPSRDILAYSSWFTGDMLDINTVTLYNPTTGQILRTTHTVATDLAWSPDGRTLAVANSGIGSITVWASEQGQHRAGHQYLP